MLLSTFLGTTFPIILQLILELSRILQAPDILAYYKSNWSNKWLPKLISVARSSRAAVVRKSATEIDSDTLSG